MNFYIYFGIVFLGHVISLQAAAAKNADIPMSVEDQKAIDREYIELGTRMFDLLKKLQATPAGKQFGKRACKIFGVFSVVAQNERANGCARVANDFLRLILDNPASMIDYMTVAQDLEQEFEDDVSKLRAKVFSERLQKKVE